VPKPRQRKLLPKRNSRQLYNLQKAKDAAAMCYVF
jgi:hypothetical protein